MIFGNILKIDEYNSLKYLKLEKIELVKKEKKIRILAKSNKIVDFFELDTAIDKIKTYYNNLVDIEMNLIYDFSIFNAEIDNSELIESIKDNIFYTLQKSSYILKRNIKYVDINFNADTFLVKVKNMFIHNELNRLNMESKLNYILSRDYNMPLKIKLICEECDSDAMTEAEKMLDLELKKTSEAANTSCNKTPPKAISTQSEPGNNTEGFKKQFRPRRKEEINFNSMPVVRIIDITEESGLISIKGNILSLEKKRTENRQHTYDNYSDR